MKRRWFFSSMLAGLGAASLLIVPGSSGFAQTAGRANPSMDQAEPATEEPPPGGCMPIGVTASGEIVFPFLCKGFIERHKTDQPQLPLARQSEQEPAATGEQRPGPDEQDKAADQKPAVTDGANKKPVIADEPRPAADGNPASAVEKSATEQSEAKDSAKPSDSAPPQVGRPVPDPVVTSALPKPARVKPRERIGPREGTSGPPVCAHFRTYDPKSQTYRDYSGQTRACRS